MKRAINRLCVLMAALTLTASFTACGTKQAASTSASSQVKDVGTTATTAEGPAGLNKTGYPIVKEKITLKMMGSKSSIQGPWEDLKFFKKMEEMTNIHFEFDAAPADTYQEKKNLAFASGEYPDVFFGGMLTENDEVTYGSSQKILIPLNNLVDQYAPNLKAYWDKNPDVRKSVTYLDGNIYALPQVQEALHCLQPSMWFNEQWCKNLGLELPKTTDELYTVLKAFKEKDPNKNGKQDEIPMSGVNGVQAGVMYAFGIVSDDIEVTDGKCAFNPITDNYKAYLEYCNKLYKEKLIDNEIFTQTEQQTKAKGVELRLGSFSHAAAWLVCKPEDDNQYVALAPLTSPQNSKQVWGKYNSITKGTFAITKTNKYPEATMRWVDYLFSPEGSIQVRFGYENEDWKYTDSTKEHYVKIVPDGMNSEEYRGGKVTPDCGTPVPVIWDTDLLSKEYNANPPSTERLLSQVEKYRQFQKQAYPQLYFTTEQQEKLATLSTDIKEYVKQMTAKFITGAEPLSNWDKYVDTMKKMNLDEYVKIYQDAYDTYSNAK